MVAAVAVSADWAARKLVDPGRNAFSAKQIRQLSHGPASNPKRYKKAPNAALSRLSYYIPLALETLAEMPVSFIQGRFGPKLKAPIIGLTASEESAWPTAPRVVRETTPPTPIGLR
jgi:hypothetical protein